MRPFPRFRRACGRDLPEEGTAGALQAQDERLAASYLLSAVLVADPVAGRDLAGNAVTHLLIVVTADPDSEEEDGRLMYEAEVPDDVAERYGRKLCAGDSVFVTGQPNGDGGIAATDIQPG